MVRIFDRVGLHKNLSKTNSMVFTPGFIWSQQGVEAYKQIDTGEVPAFRKRDKNRVSFEDYGGGGYSVLPSAPHEEVKCYSTASYYSSRRQGGRYGDLQGVVPASF